MHTYMKSYGIYYDRLHIGRAELRDIVAAGCIPANNARI